jgi:hypothetical protein
MPEARSAIRDPFLYHDSIAMDPGSTLRFGRDDKSRSCGYRANAFAIVSPSGAAGAVSP